MRAIVFGGSGFLGRQVADELKSRGHEVSVFDIKNGSDILDESQVFQAVRDHDLVFHFAGLSDIGADPRLTLQTNVIGTLNVLDAARDYNVSRFVFASTAYVFSKAGGYYGISKQAAERIVEESGVPFTCLRYGSVYGLGSDEKNRIYRMVRAALDKGMVPLEGDGSEEREYIHVRDAARLTVDILAPEYENQHVMQTGLEKYSHLGVASLLCEILGSHYKIGVTDAKPGHYYKTPYSYTPAPSKKLVANPFVDLGQGLLEMIEAMD